jgi:sodium/potassium/calcium exchanger 6
LYAWIPLTILALFFIFRFICALVDEYIGPSITYIQKWLGLSEALAGVTLLALANGAGDVITAIVASDSADGVAYNIGALFGAGLFVCTIVMTFTITGSPTIPIMIDPNTIYRDMTFYIIATLLVIACGIY